MSSSDIELIRECDTLIERGQFDEALTFLKKSQGLVTTWLIGKVYLSKAEAMSENYIFVNYANQEMKSYYRSILSEANNHLFNTVMNLTDASPEIRDYLNKCLWRQLSQTEHELARTTYWVPQAQEDENAEEEDLNWADPDNLIDYINDIQL